MSSVWLARRELFSKYVKFCLVGGSGVAVDMLVLHALASPRWLGWDLTLSKVLAAEVAICNNFLWNDVWTFRGLGKERRIRSVAPETLTEIPLAEGRGVPAEPHGAGFRTRPAHRDDWPHLSRTGAEGNAPAFSMTPPPPAGRWRHVAARLGKFNLICAAGIGLSVLLLNVQVHALGVNVYVANLIAIVVVSLWNFVLNWKWGWKLDRVATVAPGRCSGAS